MADTKLPIIGRERALIDGLTKLLHGAAGKRHEATKPFLEAKRGSSFEVHIFDPDGEPTGRVALVTVELARTDQTLAREARRRA